MQQDCSEIRHVGTCGLIFSLSMNHSGPGRTARWHRYQRKEKSLSTDRYIVSFPFLSCLNLDFFFPMSHNPPNVLAVNRRILVRARKTRKQSILRRLVLLSRTSSNKSRHFCAPAIYSCDNILTVIRTRLVSQLTGSGGALTMWRHHERKHDASFRGFFRFIAFVSSVLVISLKFMFRYEQKLLNSI